LKPFAGKGYRGRFFDLSFLVCGGGYTFAGLPVTGLGYCPLLIKSFKIASHHSDVLFYLKPIWF